MKDIGNILNALRDEEGAIRQYKMALEIDPNYAPALNNLGLIAKRNKNFQKAEELVKQETLIHLSRTIIIGSICLKQGMSEKALDCTKRAIELKPKSSEALMNLGVIYKDLGNLDEALVVTLKSLELKADSYEAWANLGTIHKKKGNMEKAMMATNRSLDIKGNNQSALINKVLYTTKKGNLKNQLRNSLKH